MISDEFLSHPSKLQPTFALSLTKAKYIADIKVREEAMKISQFLTALEFRAL